MFRHRLPSRLVDFAIGGFIDRLRRTTSGLPSVPPQSMAPRLPRWSNLRSTVAVEDEVAKRPRVNPSNLAVSTPAQPRRLCT
jgi:hypothetical protein